jgi:hypothetical protein
MPLAEALRVRDVRHVAGNLAGREPFRRAQAMIGRMLTKGVAGIDGHRRVEEDRQVGNPPRGLEAMKMVEQRLRPADGEGGNQHGAAAARRACHDVGEGILGVIRRVLPVAIGGFHHEKVG